VRKRRSGGPLRPGELAEAAVLGDLSVALLFLGWMLPLGPVLQILAVAPMAALGARRRPRAVVAAAVASSSVAFLLGGVTLWSVAVVVALIGLVVGAASRRGWGRVRLLGAAVPIWVVVAGATVGQLALFSGFRKLSFDQIRNGWSGSRRILGWMDSALHRAVGGRPLAPLIRLGNHVVSWMISHWWLVIPAGELVLLVVATLVASAVGRPAIRRVEQVLGPPAPPVPAVAHDAPPGPVPARLEEVAYRYPGAADYALREVNIEIPAERLLAVVGLNGSGKSTLARIVAGLVEAEGEVVRPGGPGLGRPGGTAVIFQRPESQVLGARVRDDVVWGMGPRAAAAVDVGALLARVGLDGMEEEETSTLSGGQLQRLAIAAALARSPRLLVSDESTSMLDPAGRRQVADLLACLPAEEGVTVLQVTHRKDEAARADTAVEVVAGRVTTRDATVRSGRRRR
jgi:energy-coupling factor transporter ATP-binding protein EcfA2